MPCRFYPVPLRVLVHPLPILCPTGTFSSMAWTPWHFLVVAISGWMNREQQQVIDYLREENRRFRWWQVSSALLRGL
jgi:hypothetical protein